MSNQKLSVRIFDDDESNAAKYKESIDSLGNLRDRVSAELIPLSEFEKCLSELLSRQKNFRDDGDQRRKPCAMDTTDVLVIDIDLAKATGFTTGEDIAYGARCFSNCGVIIGVGVRMAGLFDLSLRSDMRSFCDINIGNDQVGNPGLWLEKRSGFRPWVWPEVIKYAKNLKSMRNELSQTDVLNARVIDYFGFEENGRFLPDDVAEFLGAEPRKTTFARFPFESGYGLNARDKASFEKLKTPLIMVPLIASRISKWLEESILPRQDILVDAPHLVSRYPSLLSEKDSKGEVSVWNLTTRFESADSIGIRAELLRNYLFKRDKWLTRPAWFWSDVSDCPDIEEVKSPWEREEPLFGFCEDSSAFYPRQECKRVRVGLDTDFFSRYVRKHEGYLYLPQGRILE